ncbi:MAG: hypothetical protein KF888_08140 [Nitrosomonas sp.]|nr:hypothetical protein [Nitrosomonas sp.]
MPRKYHTIDFLDDLTSTQMTQATKLTYKVAHPNNVGWDFEARVNGSEPGALSHSIYSFTATEGATYDIFSESFFDPYLLRLFDKNGNVIEANSEYNDPADFILGGVSYGVDLLEDWVAPYTGTYYVQASWNQGVVNTFYDLSIYEDRDTISSEPMSAKAGRIFNWAEEEYSLLFPDHPETETVGEFKARIYSSGAALGEKDGDLYFYDGALGGSDTIILLGSVSDFLPLALADGF